MLKRDMNIADYDAELFAAMEKKLPAKKRT